MANKAIRGKWRCTNCMVDKSRLLKQKYNKKSGFNNINPKIFIYSL